MRSYKTFIELCHYFSVPGGYWSFEQAEHCIRRGVGLLTLFKHFQVNNHTKTLSDFSSFNIHVVSVTRIPTSKVHDYI